MGGRWVSNQTKRQIVRRLWGFGRLKYEEKNPGNLVEMLLPLGACSISQFKIQYNDPYAGGLHGVSSRSLFSGN
jgi:hypothetical protein